MAKRFALSTQGWGVGQLDQLRAALLRRITLLGDRSPRAFSQVGRRYDLLP